MWEIFKSYIIITIMLVAVMAFGEIVLKKQNVISFKKRIILFILISILQTIVFINLTGTEKTLLMLLTNIILLKCTYNISFLKSLFLSFLHMIILIIPDIFQLLVLTNVFKMDKDYCYNIYAGSIIANLVTSILFTALVLLLRKQLRKIVNTEASTNFKIIVLSIATLISISLFFYSIVKKFEFSNDIIQYLIAIVVLATSLFILIKQTIENNRITKEYDSLLEFMTTFENEIEKQRILRHETKNEFLTIRAKICDNQKDKEIVEYIDEILQDKIEVKQEEYAKFGYLPPNGIKGLCYFKVQEAEEKGIKVSLNISKRIKESTIYSLNTKQQREFGRILGVLLDNAIEASSVAKERKIGIEAYTNKEKELKMIISNTYSNRINKNKIGKERFSTKGKNRGHGLLLIKHIIKGNKRFELSTTVENNIYSQTIIIKKV